jgi:hypothetical protein
MLQKPFFFDALKIMLIYDDPKNNLHAKFMLRFKCNAHAKYFISFVSQDGIVIVLFVYTNV